MIRAYHHSLQPSGASFIPERIGGAGTRNSGFASPAPSRCGRLYANWIWPFAASRAFHHTPLDLRQKFASRIVDGFQGASLSAGRSGLAALSDGHRVDRKEKACPTRDGSNLTRNGAQAS